MKDSTKLRVENDQFTWYNEPAKWLAEANRLSIWAEGSTDFWRITHYNFIRDNGHLCYLEQAGNFIATVKVKGGIILTTFSTENIRTKLGPSCALL